MINSCVTVLEMQEKILQIYVTALSGPVGTLTHMKNNSVAMKVAPGLALGAFTGAYFGGKFGLSIPEEQLKYGFSGVMVVLGIRNLLKI